MALYFSRLPRSSNPNRLWPGLCRRPPWRTTTHCRSAPVPGRSNVAQPSGIGLAKACRRLDIAAAGDGRAPPAFVHPKLPLAARLGLCWGARPSRWPFPASRRPQRRQARHICRTQNQNHFQPRLGGIVLADGHDAAPNGAGFI